MKRKDDPMSKREAETAAQPRGKRVRQVECTTYLPIALKERVRAQAARERRSESKIVLEALRQYYSARSHPAAVALPSQRVWSLPSIAELVAATGAIGATRHRRRRRRKGRACCCCCRRLKDTTAKYVSL